MSDLDNSCPAGHALPNVTPKGQCTPFYCAEDTLPALPQSAKSKRQVQKQLTREKAIQKAIEKQDEKLAKLNSTEEIIAARYEDAKVAEDARRKFANVPDGLTGASAEEFADRKAIELLPLAMAELEYQLRCGDDDQRIRASRDIRDMTGRGKREGQNGGAAPIIMISGGVTLPWMSAKQAKQVEVVDVTAVNALPSKALPDEQ